MLKKEQRIRKQKEYDKIFANYKKFSSQSFQIRARIVNENEKKDGLLYPRFGFIVSKKIGKAVVRNRAKRLLREIIRLELPNLKDNFEAIVIAYPQITEKTYQELKDEIVVVLNSNNLYK